MSDETEKFSAKFDEKLVEPPNEKYLKPILPLTIQQAIPITVNIKVPKKKSLCSIQ